MRLDPCNETDESDDEWMLMRMIRREIAGFNDAVNHDGLAMRILYHLKLMWITCSKAYNRQGMELVPLWVQL